MPILAQDGVREIAVLAREDQPGDKRLVAYFVGEADTEVLREQLAQRLADYMLPSAFVQLDHLPLTPNGKLDRRALPRTRLYRCTRNLRIAPRNPTEITLAECFAHSLRLSTTVGIHDNFFRLGGDSILSIQLVSRAARQGIVLSVKDIFQYPTIAQLATMTRTTSLVQASQTIQTGQAPLLPIQRWFLEADQPEQPSFQPILLVYGKTTD